MSTQAEQKMQRQQAQIKKDQEQAAKQQKQVSQPDGGISQPQYRAGRGGPTWSDSPAGEELRKQYEKTGVVFDSKGNVVYNPADMGSSAAESARAAAGLPPSYETRGEPSPEYAAQVYQASKGAITELRSSSERLDAERGEVLAKERAARAEVAAIKAEIAQIRPEYASFKERYPGLIDELRVAEANISSYQSQLQRIDAARTDVATKTSAAEKARKRALISLAETTAGPVPVRNALGATAKPAPKAEPQRQRVEAQTGVTDKLFANPSFMQDAENYTRPTLYQDDVRKTRLQTLTGQPDSEYANPDFLSFDQQKTKPTKTNYFISLDESPQLYTLDFGGGKKVEGLSSAEVAEYQKTFELGRKLYEFKLDQYYADLKTYSKELKTQGIERVPVVTQGRTVFVPVDNLAARMKTITKADPNARISAFVPLSESLSIEAKPIQPTDISQTASGKQSITVSTPAPKPPKYELMSFIPLSVTGEPTELKGIGMFKEQGQGLVTIDGQVQQTQTATTPAREEFNRLLRQTERETLKAGEQGDYLGQFIGEIKKEALSTVAYGQNLFTKYAVEPVQAFKYKQTFVPFAQLYTPQTITGIGTGGVIASAAKLAPLTPLGPILKPSSTLQPKNTTEVIMEAGTDAVKTFESDVVQKGSEYVQTYGPATIVGAIVGGVIIGGPAPTKLLKVVPLRYGALPMYTKQGETIAQKTLAFGYDTRNIPIVTKYGVYGQGKFKIGKIDPAKTGIREQEGISGSSFDRWQPPNLTPYQQTMYKRLQAYAEEQGITPKGFAEGVERTSVRQRDAMPSAGFEYEKQVPGKILPAVPGYEGGSVVETGSKSTLDKLYQRGGMADEGIIVYHGTTKAGAEKILSGRIQENLYTAPTFKEAAGYGDVVLAVKLKPGTKFTVGEFAEEGSVRLGKVDRLGGTIREAEIPTPDLIEKVTVAKTAGQFLKESKPTLDVFAGVGKVIREKLTEPAKGSLIYRMVKGGLSREVGDIDIEAKSMAKGEKAVASLLKTEVPEGYALERQGFNIAIGQADPEKAFFDIKLAKGELAHGTDLESALQIQKYGADPAQRPYGMPAFFATEDASIFANFASGSRAPRVVVGRIKDPANLLEYKDIPKRERKRIIDTSFEMEKRYGIPQWAGYQELLAEYATKRGYKAVTKPYKGLTPDAPKFETIVLEKGVFEAEKIVEPSRYGIKEGTGTKIINIVTEKEQIKNIGGLDTSKVYGKSYPSKKIKYDIPGGKEQFASLSMEYQYQAKLASVGGVESRASLKGEGLSDAEIDRIMGGYQYIRAPKGRRFIKDVMDKYLGERETARVQFQKGDRAGALKSAEAMRATQEYYGKMFDFGKAFREYRLSVDETPQIKGESLLEKASGSVGRGASRTAPRGIPQDEPEQESISIRSGRTRSAMSARSAPTSISARTSAAQPSIYSAKQASVRISTKSGSIRQSSTTKSPRMRSSSTKSLFSPSPKSALAPSPKSGFTPSPKSAGSPSIKSPPSPRITSAPSPMITSPPSPIIRPVPEILKPKPLPVPKAVPFVKQRTDKARELAEKERADFLGQAKVSDIVGFGKRGDITYGRTLTARLASGDVRESGARYGRFSRTRSAKLLDRTKPALLKKNKKEKVFKL